MPQVTSKHLQGITDLTLVAPIKQGFVDSLETWTYKTRLRLVMQALNTSRAVTREQSAFRPFSDTVERIQGLHSFRLSLLAPDQLLLAVAFDGGWEPYIRKIWWDLGPLLDLIFCNCEGYKSAFDHGFDEYTACIRSRQVDTGFFYVASGLTVTDLQYARQLEKLHRETAGADLEAAQLFADDPEDLARAAMDADEDESKVMGLRALSALYRLAHMYPIDSEQGDGRYLLRAAHELLKELRDRTQDFYPPNSDERRLFAAPLAWFEKATPRPAGRPERLEHQPDLVQGGIVTSYDDLHFDQPMTHGCLLLMQATDAQGARNFLGELAREVSREGQDPVDGSIHVNVALTFQGLERLEVPAAELEKFPKEFREGMEARADLLGDFRSNHPANWPLPERNWPQQGAAGGDIGRVQLSAVDIVVQLRTRAGQAGRDHEIADNEDHPLFDKVKELSEKPGVRLLSVEPMLRVGGDGKNAPTGHLGFVDGISQPKPKDEVVPPVPEKWSDDVRWGEVFCGYGNDRRDGPIRAEDGAYLDNGTFLVVRKLGLDMPALKAFYEAHKGTIGEDDLKAKMMGRTPGGDPLAARGNTENDFTYAGDTLGEACPFQAHIRRANPRTVDKPQVPRIMRRGMSYGPGLAEEADAERGLMFLAYNASIAEQFEVIQRWISGGNSSGVFSGESDPFLGVPQPGDPRTFRFQQAKGVVCRVELGDKPFAQLQWGVYLFVPSLPVLQKIAAPAPSTTQLPFDPEAISKLIDTWQSMEPAKARVAWKACLEDLKAKEDGINAAVWAVIRMKHGGVLRTAYGVLVGSATLVNDVFMNRGGLYYSVEGHSGPSVEGYKQRMARSIGENYLGLDDDGPTSRYQRESGSTNTELMSHGLEGAFAVARGVTDTVIARILASFPGRRAELDLRTMISDNVLAGLSKAWFGLPDDDPALGVPGHVKSGGWNWDSNPERPSCPGDFTSPSRYIFSPDPSDAVKSYAERHGQFLQAAVRAYVTVMRQKLGGLPDISKAMFDAIPEAENDRLARTIIGAMMGFLPTVDGNFRSVMHQWLSDRSLWRLQSNLVFSGGASPYERAIDALLVPLMRAMQRSPVPYGVWRTAKVEHMLGNVRVQAGEKIVVGIISATQEYLVAKRHDVFPVFGGDRRIPGAPTHACPAYNMGMGALLGMISGLLEAGTLRPLPAPLTVTLIGK